MRALEDAVAILTAPLAMTAVLLALSLRFAGFVPPIVTAEDKMSLLLLGVATGLGGGLLEELGWTGFAIPRLRLRHGVFATGLGMGVLWAAWHLPQGLWTGGTYAGAFPLIPFLLLNILAGLAYLTAYRVLMVWVYDHTESLLVAIIMHASLIANTMAGFVLVPPGISGVSFLVMFFAFAAVLWGLVLLQAVSRSRSEPARGRSAPG